MKNHAFSLVELVIVVVIVGLLAAVAIPRLSRGASGASDAALQASLNTLRNSIELYAAEHGGAFPGYHAADGTHSGNGDPDDFYAQLLGYSTANGEVGPRGNRHPFGPYLPSIPRLNLGRNASKDADEVAFVTGGAPTENHQNDKGWVYNPSTGQIIANLKGKDTRGMAYTDY